jgi:PmbA protein
MDDRTAGDPGMPSCFGIPSMTVSVDSQALVDRVVALVEAARKAGADAADAVAVVSRSTGVSVRLGKVEATEMAESDDISLRVFVGQRVASVSATPAMPAKAMAERAVAMARVSPVDPYQGLAEAGLLARDFCELDLLDRTAVTAKRLKEDALAIEEAALSVKGVTNSVGASAGASLGGLVLTTSHGFLGHYLASRFSRSVSVIAGEGTAMERDYDFCSRLHFTDLEPVETIGRRAGERAVRRLGARKARTGKVTVIFDPRVARSMAGHMAAAINGAAVARKTSFLRDRMGEQVAAAGITITDDPLRPRRPGSRPFDGEGVEGRPLMMVDKGVLKHWLLSSAVARELGLVTNGRGVRVASSVNPASTNLAIEPGEVSPADLIAGLDRAFYVTELFGQGVNIVTGEYSRGAAGFWIEKGEIAWPVSEVTIAGNLKEMFLRMTAADDIDRNFSTTAPTLLVEGMTIAGD